MNFTWKVEEAVNNTAGGAGGAAQLLERAVSPKAGKVMPWGK